MRIRSSVLVCVLLAAVVAFSSVANAQDAADAKAAAAGEAAPPANKGKFAYVTMLTNIDFGYVIGLEVLAKSIRATGSRVPLVCLVADIMIPNNLRKEPDPMLTTEQDLAVNEILERLHFAGYAIRFGQTIPNPNPIVEREWFRGSYTKVHIFALEDYELVLYLDADMLVLQNLDHLFELKIHRIAAVPDILPPDRFQSGLMLVRPSREVHAQLLQAIAADAQYLKECKEKDVAPDFNSEAAKYFSYDGGDQGFLNAAFSDWYYSDPVNKLPFVYNTLASVASLYPPAWRHLHEKRITKVIHFSGDPKMKPWFEGERAIMLSLAPYVYVWQSIARVVQAQTAHRLQLKQNGEWSPFAVEGQLHPWFSQPPIPEDDPRFKDFVISYTNLGNIIATHDPKVIESWFQAPQQQQEQQQQQQQQAAAEEPPKKEEL